MQAGEVSAERRRKPGPLQLPQTRSSVGEPARCLPPDKTPGLLEASNKRRKTRPPIFKWSRDPPPVSWSRLVRQPSTKKRKAKVSTSQTIQPSRPATPKSELENTLKQIAKTKVYTLAARAGPGWSG